MSEEGSRLTLSHNAARVRCLYLIDESTDIFSAAA